VFHFHVHVVPRYQPEELQLMWEAERAPEAELERLQQRVLACHARLVGGRAEGPVS
jgi:diadenosine tetraphosphate (Ap4A) HIT family hydrolase